MRPAPRLDPGAVTFDRGLAGAPRRLEGVEHRLGGDVGGRVYRRAAPHHLLAPRWDLRRTRKGLGSIGTGKQAVVQVLRNASFFISPAAMRQTSRGTGLFSGSTSESLCKNTPGSPRV